MRIITPIIILFLTVGLYGQSETLEKKAKNHFDNSYISDGQTYKVMLNYDEEGEFEVTFFSRTMYRIAITSTVPQSDITYSITDSERNIIYTSQDFDNSPYWDFVFTSSFDCKIIVKIENPKVKSGIALMLIGYKNPPEIK